ncbi:hypothetical protein AB1Y20_005771 [Prymnesium parvum]|uniref:Nucleotide-diphospho-sugar transferase domain-containing protein n=1 Tax=Prymnesium parvum TaxID=97485 RepID=A0AB34IZT5_PRYPA
MAGAMAPAMAGTMAGVEEAARLSAANGTVFATFTSAEMVAFTLNWCKHLRRLGVLSPLVGVMGPPLPRLPAERLRALGAVLYRARAAESELQRQGGRWFHLLPLLSTGLRVVLSDSDVVWFRHPLAYFAALEAAHPRLDFSISTDAQGASRARRMEGSSDLDVEVWTHCHESMNLGIMHFPPGRRAGSLEAVRQMVAHLREKGNLRRVDQGPINYRWKRGSGLWKWEKPLHAVRDASGGRLCALVNGSVVAAVLPVAQFGNTLTLGLLRLDVAAAVAPYAMHATFMRRQSDAHKIARLREYALWHDPPEYYKASRELRLLTVALHLPPWRGVTIGRGGIPLPHFRLMAAQLTQLRDALFLSRLLRRTLVLPRVACGCELGFFPRHLRPSCTAHPLALPYNCSVDHFLHPPALLALRFYALREASFTANPRADPAFAARVARVRRRADNFEVAAAAEGRAVRLPLRPSASRLVAALGGVEAPTLHVDDLREMVGSLDGAGGRGALVEFHAHAQALLSSWCCTSDERFRRSGGEVPYLLPPLEGQSEWLGEPRLAWAATALASVFRGAGEHALAARLSPCEPGARVFNSPGCKRLRKGRH